MMLLAGCMVAVQAMVTQWGMSETVGLVFHSKDDQSPETRAAIDREVRKRGAGQETGGRGVAPLDPAVGVRLPLNHPLDEHVTR